MRRVSHVWVVECRKRSAWSLWYASVRRTSASIRLKDLTILNPDLEFRLVKYVPVKP